MSWISDVRTGVDGLDLSARNLRKFGLLVGGVFLVLALVMIYTASLAGVRTVLLLAGIALMVCGAVVPHGLKKVYQVWMGGALAIGWVVSRILLIIIYFLVLTPIALLARLVGKDFLDIRGPSRDSYWVKTDPAKAINYEKMY